jgi:hypothetical protein
LAVCLHLHHAPKPFSKEETAMTLENTHRGGGDFGTMMTMSFAVARVDEETTRLHVECVKHRDTDPFAQAEYMQTSCNSLKEFLRGIESDFDAIETAQRCPELRPT